MKERKHGLPPVHPGEIIKQDILPSVGLSVTVAAKALRVSRQMLHDILAERKPLSAVMCLKVSRLFGGTVEESRPERLLSSVSCLLSPCLPRAFTPPPPTLSRARSTTSRLHSPRPPQLCPTL
jgi:addiction module HigA family antidote